MTVGVRWPSDNDISVIPDDTIRDKLCSDSLSVFGNPVSTRKSCVYCDCPPETPAGHSGQLSRDDQHHKLANSKHLYVHSAGRPFIREMHITLHVGLR